MDAHFDWTSPISEFKNLQLHSPTDSFPPSQCEGEFDSPLFNYPTSLQHTIPQQYYDSLPTSGYPRTYCGEEASDSDSSIHTPPSITSPAVESNYWTGRAERSDEHADLLMRNENQVSFLMRNKHLVF